MTYVIPILDSSNQDNILNILRHIQLTSLLWILTINKTRIQIIQELYRYSFQNINEIIEYFFNILINTRRSLGQCLR